MSYTSIKSVDKFHKTCTQPIDLLGLDLWIHKICTPRPVKPLRGQFSTYIALYTFTECTACKTHDMSCVCTNSSELIATKACDNVYNNYCTVLRVRYTMKKNT